MTDNAAPRTFKVRYEPENTPWNHKPPNNLRLVGAGVLEIAGEAVVLHDSANALTQDARTLALANIANVGFRAEDHLIVLRTRDGAQEAGVWMQSAEDAHDLLAILPRETTPEFLEHERKLQQFHANMLTLAPKAPVTPTIIGLNVAVFVLMCIAGADVFQGSSEVALRFGANYGPATWNDEPWRLLTSAFIHFGIIHLAFNMYALFNGGFLVERLYGSARFAVIYLMSALAGSVVSSWWDPTRLSAGASGAVFGVYGAMLAFLLRRRGDIPMSVFTSASRGALSLIVYSLAMGMGRGIDNAAHVGGLLGGAVAGLLLVRPFDSAARATRRPWQVAAVAALVCAALAVLSAQLWLPSSPRGEEIRLEAQVQAVLDRQNKLDEHFTDLWKQAEKKQLTGSAAAARMRTEVIAPWDEIIKSTMALPLVGDKDSPPARRVAALQEYTQARRVAMAKTVLALETASPIFNAQAGDAWQRVKELADVAEQLDSGKH